MVLSLETAEIAELTEKELLINELVAAASTAKRSENYTPNLDAQRTVLNNLPENLVELLHGHLHVAQKEQNYFDTLHKRPLEIVDDKTVVCGELFELLVESQYLKQEAAVVDELLAFFHDPARFELNKLLGHVRNPDLAYVHYDSNAERFVIDAAGEAKLGLLNKRAFSQLKEFEEKFKRVAQILNLDELDLEAHGLEALSEFQGSISISKAFKRILFVPANRDAADIDSLIRSDPQEFTDDEYEEFYSMLDNTNFVDIQKSVFSTQEVSKMAEVLVQKIKSQYITSISD